MMTKEEKKEWKAFLLESKRNFDKASREFDECLKRFDKNMDEIMAGLR